MCCIQLQKAENPKQIDQKKPRMSQGKLTSVMKTQFQSCKETHGRGTTIIKFEREEKLIFTYLTKRLACHFYGLAQKLPHPMGTNQPSRKMHLKLNAPSVETRTITS